MKCGAEKDLNNLGGQSELKRAAPDEFTNMLPDLLEEVFNDNPSNFRNALKEYNITDIDLSGRIKGRQLFLLSKALIDTKVTFVDISGNGISNEEAKEFWDVLNNKLECSNILKRVNVEGNSEDIVLAAASGLSETVKSLLEGGADPAVVNNCAIRWAAQNGHAAVVALLLEVNHVISAQAINYAFATAADNGHAEVVALLLKDGRFDPAIENSCFIGCAARDGLTDIVALLLEDQRADPAAYNDYAIGVAAQNGHLDIVKLLLENETVKSNLTHEYIKKENGFIGALFNFISPTTFSSEDLCEKLAQKYPKLNERIDRRKLISAASATVFSLKQLQLSYPTDKGAVTIPFPRDMLAMITNSLLFTTQTSETALKAFKFVDSAKSKEGHKCNQEEISNKSRRI